MFLLRWLDFLVAHDSPISERGTFAAILYDSRSNSEIENYRNLDAILASKSAPVLAHVSIMIALLGIYIGSYQPSGIKLLISIVEIILYLIMAIGCLRVVHSVGYSRQEIESLTIGDGASADVHLKIYSRSARDLLIKERIFRFVNNATVAVTVILIATTPYLFWR